MTGRPSITSPILLDCNSPVYTVSEAMQDLIDHLCLSPAFEAQLSHLHEGWVIEPASHMEDDHPYFIQDQVIELVLSPIQTVNALHLAAAVRDAWHHQSDDQDAGPVHPQAFILQSRMRMADLACFALQVAWEMRDIGGYDLWRTALASVHGDMAMIFQNVMARSVLDPDMEMACEAAFIHWFSDQDRVRETDRDSLTTLDLWLEEDDAAAFVSLFAPNTLSRSDLVAIGYQATTGLTYLSRLADQLQKDPYFFGMEDQVNQTYLQHIMRDLETTRVHHIAFRDEELASRLFPNGEVLAYN